MLNRLVHAGSASAYEFVLYDAFRRKYDEIVTVQSIARNLFDCIS